ncbi:GcrA family cell cycle regulator [Jannaschia formosa]|uniref:GcrA family cell cycle regulator n=1 Tax=Jannaschia formosa TaxID=2259592 RepID=UPI000E1B6968|nr:GcrA family cell cycle regulator [Jannaschia formosa]TFL19131.1 GcrA cell cycle regulator [Jannaschia formosa]
MAWTDERVETLKRMWGEGASASQIAKELGGVTRNAVIGKVHRLGLSNRNQGKEDEAAPAEASEAVAAAPEPEADPAPEPEFAAAPEPDESDEEEDDDDEPRTMAAVPQGTNVTPLRKPLMAGQPLPPQPSANEISAEALAKVNAVEKTAKKISLMELTERTCKWPIGDPATEKFWFCGLPVQAGKPYCEAHVSVAFQPMSSRRDRRR